MKGFKPRDDNGGSASVDAKDTFTNKTKFQMAGPHRLVVTQDTVKFFRLDGSHESRNFPVRLISGHSEPKSRSDILLIYMIDKNQVWSLARFYSVDFLQSRIGVILNKRTIKVCVSCC